MSILVFDIETDGLLEDVTKWHCGVIVDQSKEVAVYRPHELQYFLEDLSNGDLIVGHNVLGYDLPVLKKLFGYIHDGPVYDTLVVARTLFPDRPQGHSLKSYGPKGTFGETSDWKEYSEEMLEYCKVDTLITFELLARQCKQLNTTFEEIQKIDLWNTGDITYAK